MTGAEILEIAFKFAERDDYNGYKAFILSLTFQEYVEFEKHLNEVKKQMEEGELQI